MNTHIMTSPYELMQAWAGDGTGGGAVPPPQEREKDV